MGKIRIPGRHERMRRNGPYQGPNWTQGRIQVEHVHKMYNSRGRKTLALIRVPTQRITENCKISNWGKNLKGDMD
jgi:hypothetical protein